MCFLLALLVLGAVAPPTAAAAAPTYVATIGGPGHAEMYPSGLDVDAAGTIYVADTGGDAVEAYDAAGARLWKVGTRGPKSLSSFRDPRDVAYLTGLVYVADTANRRVVVLDAATGAGFSQWATPGANPIGISAGVDGDGDSVILVTLDNTNAVAEYTPGGTLVRTIGGSKGAAPGQLNAPRDAATNAAGDVYVADYLNNRISQFDADGTFMRTWGATGTADGRFLRPYGVDVDDAGDVYVADSNNQRIQKFGPTGAFLVKWGSPGVFPGQFAQLRRVAVGSGLSPQVYGADLWGYRIQRFDQVFGYQQTWAGAGPAEGMLNEPSGVSVIGDQVWVADAVNQRVNRYATDGTFQLSFAHRGWGKDLDGVAWARDIAADPDAGTVWVADTKNSRLLEFTNEGVSTGRSLGGQGTGPGQFFWPAGLTTFDGNLIVADTNNNRVVSIDPDGPTTLWTATGMKAPSDVFVRGTTAYVADTGNKRIVLLDVGSGALLGTIANETKLHSPQGVAVDAGGNVWVSDTTWNKVVEFDSAGNFVQGFGSLGTDANHFMNPTKLDISEDLLYVADEWNDRIQVFDVGALDSPPGTSFAYSRDIGVDQTSQTSPVDIVRSPAGNWFVVDEGQACLEEYAPTDLSAPVRTFFTCGTVGKDATHISRARGIGIDPGSGAVWIADTSNHRVLKLDPATGTLLVNTSVPAAAGGPLNSPGDVAVDADGNAYVIDQRDRVVKLAADGSYLSQWGASGNGAGQMRNPMSIAFSSVGGNALYVTDSRNFQVDKWSPSGSFLASFGSAGTGNGKMTKDARGIAVDDNGVVYVADVGGNRIIRFAANGSALTSLGSGLPYGRNGPLDIFYGARGLWVDGNTLAVTDMWGYRVLFWTLAGASTGEQIGGGDVPCSADLVDFGPAPPCNGHNEPRGLAFDAEGNLYVSDYWHQWIEKFGPDGTLLAHWGAGRGSDPGTLNLAAGLAVDNARGYLYIANRENRHVDRWNLADGSFDMRFPMPAGPAFADGWPRDVAVDEASGRIYAADEMNNQLVIFAPGSTTPLAVISRSGSGAGQPLGSLHSLAWDPSAGALYVADYSNRMIHVYDGDGQWLRSFPVTGTPNGVEVANGIVYVMTYRLSMYDTEGTLLATFGSTGSGDSQFLQPYGGVAVTPTGEVAIGDSGNHRVKVLSPS